MKYKAYTVVNAGHLRSLEAIVNLKLTKGWIPLGGVYSVSKEKRMEPIYEISGDGNSLEPTEKEYESTTNWCQSMVLPSGT